MTAYSVWHTISSALLTGMRARTGYCSTSAYVSGLIPVYDGVEAHLARDQGPARFLVVRFVGTKDDPQAAGGVGQSTGPLGTLRPRTERGYIRCRAAAQTGDAGITGDASAQWDAAYGVLADVEDLMRTSPTLGVVATHIVVELGAVDDARQYEADGIVTELDFTVNYRARI